MKTYKKTTTTTEKRLVINNDNGASSPRDWTNLGYFITVDRNYSSPDENETMETIIRDTGDESENIEEHMKGIIDGIEFETGDKVIAIYPITKYEHSGISYSLGTAHGFDNSNNGFYIITENSLKEVGAKKENFESIIEDEINYYNKWLNGEVYNFTLLNNKGEIKDSGYGFYSMNEIKKSLPEEWQNEDMSEYLEE